MLKRVLSIAGKPGLFELLSQGNNMLIVENIETKQRQPAYSNDKVISLADIAIFTEDEEVPLAQVFESIKSKQGGKLVEIDLKSKKELRDFFGSVLSNFDQNRVYDNDIRKVIRWYNILTAAGKTEFVEAAAAPAKKATKAKAEKAEKAEETPAEEAGLPKKKRTRKKAADNAEEA